MLSPMTDSRVLAISCAPPSQSVGAGRHSATRTAAVSGSNDRNSSAPMGLTANWAVSGGPPVRLSLVALPYLAARMSHAVPQAPVAWAGNSGTHRIARSQSSGTSSAPSARPACSTSGAAPRASLHRDAKMEGPQSVAARSNSATSSPVGAREEIACSISSTMRRGSTSGAFASTPTRSRCLRLLSGSLPMASRRSLAAVHAQAFSNRRSRHDNNSRDRSSRADLGTSATDPEGCHLSLRSSRSSSGSERIL